MANKQVSSELKRYFHEMKNDATSHDKVFLLITIAILVGCGVGSFRNLSATVHWPKATFALAAIILGVAVWLASFTLGVILRTPSWQHVFPPYRLIGKATVPTFIVAIVTGSIVGITLFEKSLANSAAASFLGYVVVFVGMHLLFLLHKPLTENAFRISHNPNIMTVDSHRYLWFFPAICVLALSLATKRFMPAESEAIRHIAVAAAIATSTMVAGFGAGYIP